MNKRILGATMALLATGAMAQETYESARLASEDLNGTARYIGMGGAMEALGADISTMGTNPAGIGLFRRTWLGASAGLSVNMDDNKHHTTNGDFNQLGFVYTFKLGYASNFNMGFNYHKELNLNQVFCAVNTLNTYSAMNKASLLRAFNNRDDNGKVIQDALSIMDQLNAYTVNDTLMNATGGSEKYAPATDYTAGQQHSGYISQFDFNFSGNINNRLYLGLTFGLRDVRYDKESWYYENLVNSDPATGTHGYYSLYDKRRITGTGFNIKFGAIVRPVEELPLRIGAYIHTPTWYELKCEDYMAAEAKMYNVGSTNPTNPNQSYDADYAWEYKIITPWKFGVSVGYTIDKFIALGATYEYSDYSSIKNQVVDGYYYGYNSTRNTYANDRTMNRNTENSLRGVHLFKAGMEIKPSQVISLRLGYNYESAAYNMNGSKDCTSDADYTYYSGAYTSTGDYINWRSTKRFTGGIGFTLSKNFAIDLSYQFNMQKGEYHPFQTVTANNSDATSNLENSNIGTMTEIWCYRHQVNCTLGYRF